MAGQDRARIARRARLAVLVVMSLVFAGLPSSALARSESSVPTAAPASGGTSIRGKVVIPAGLDHVELYVAARTFDASQGTWPPSFHGAVPQGDGSFEIGGLDPAVEYRLEVQSENSDFVGGFYTGPGGTLARFAADGVPVFTSTTLLELNLLPSADITGVFFLPSGFVWGDRNFRIFAEEIDADGTTVLGERSTSVSAASGGTFRLRGLRADTSYAIAVRDDPGVGPDRFPAGYFHAEASALVGVLAHATRVPGGSQISLHIETTFATPQLKSVSPPSVSGSPAVGESLSANPGVWSFPGVTLSYQWLRNDTPIAGATASSRVITAADLGSRLAVRVTARRAGFISASATSAPSATVAKGAAPRTATSPTLKGTVRLGKTLRVTTGSWSPAGARLTYQWLRAGKAIKGATASRYTLKRADVGKRVSVRVTAALPGHHEGVATSSAKKVAKGKPKVTLKAKTVKAAKRPKVVVRVKAAGLPKPRGTVVVKYGKKTIKVKLAAKRKGKITVQLPRLARGKHRITVTFKPDGSSKALVTSARAKVTLRVK